MSRINPAAEMSMVEHLRELRGRLLKCALAVVVGMIVVWVFYDQLFAFLKNPYCSAMKGMGKPNCALYTRDPLTPFAFRLKLSGYGGFMMAMPVLLWQAWRFVAPGLKKNESRWAVAFVASATILFAMGVALAYLTLPEALRFLLNIGGDIENLTEVTSYTSLFMYTSLAFGLGFEFPIVLIFLQLSGLVAPATLSRYRRFWIVGIAFVAAVITPSTDPFSFFALGIPMYLFYELSILIGRVATRHRPA